MRLPQLYSAAPGVVSGRAPALTVCELLPWRPDIHWDRRGPRGRGPGDTRSGHQVARPRRRPRGPRRSQWIRSARLFASPAPARAGRWRAALDLLVLAGALIPILDGSRHRDAIPRLSAVTAADAGVDRPLPRLSVVVPARDEEGGVRAAVASMLRQDYPALGLVLVDDRSTDRTGAIMAGLAAAHPDRVRAVTVDHLPPGWLGKNHALWLGARQASGDLLLFADADMVFALGLLRRAVAYLEDEGLDHLTLAPAIVARGFWLALFVDFFVYGFATTQRLYRVNSPRSDVGVGFGAFNLVRRAAYERVGTHAYERVGTHAVLSLRPDDDVRLGRRIKRIGLRRASDR